MNIFLSNKSRWDGSQFLIVTFSFLLQKKNPQNNEFLYINNRVSELPNKEKLSINRILLIKCKLKSLGLDETTSKKFEQVIINRTLRTLKSYITLMMFTYNWYTVRARFNHLWGFFSGGGGHVSIYQHMVQSIY